MPRFFFNARRPDGQEIQDRQGLEYADVVKARTEAERARNEVQRTLLESGVPLVVGGVVEVRDEAGHTVERIPGPGVAD